MQDLAPRTNFDTLRPASLLGEWWQSCAEALYASNNYDVSLEWYPSSTTTLTGAVFYKDVKDFIVQTRADEVFTIANAGGLPVGGLDHRPE